MLKHTMNRDSWSEKNIAEKGFTLIELLVVIVILGVLAAVVVLAVGQIRARGEENACKTEKKTIGAAVALYYDTNGSYPSMTQLTATTDFLQTPPKYAFSISSTNGTVTSGTGNPGSC